MPLEPPGQPALAQGRAVVPAEDRLQIRGRRHQGPFPAAPALPHRNRGRQADVHVGFPQQQIAFDQQFLQVAAFETGTQALGHLEQPVGLHPQGKEGDVGRHDPGRLAAALQQDLHALQPQGFAPAPQPVPVTVGGGLQDDLLEQVQPQGEHGGAGMLLAPAPGGAGVDAVAAVAVDHPAVLDHAALREDHDLVPLEDFRGQQGQQPGVVVGHGAGGAQQPGQAGIDFEQFPVGDGVAVGAAVLVDQVLGDEGFETGELVEDEDLALAQVVAGVVEFDVQAQKTAGEAEQLDRVLVEAAVDREVPGVDGAGRQVHGRPLKPGCPQCADSCRRWQGPEKIRRACRPAREAKSMVL